MISELHASHNSRIVLNSRGLTEKQVITLLSDFLLYPKQEVERAIARAGESPWEPQYVGLHGSVTCTRRTERTRYRVCILGR